MTNDTSGNNPADGESGIVKGAAKKKPGGIEVPVSSNFAGSDGDRMRSSLTGSDGDRK